MIIDFTKPYFLILIPVAILFIYFVGKKAKETKFNKRLLTIIRSIVCVVLVLALSGMTVKKYTDITTTIFAVDLSASVKGSEESTKLFLNEAQKSRTDNDVAGIICFGEKAVVETSPSKNFSLSEYHSFVNDNFTSISDAMKLAATIIPEESRKRIVLVSDGNENLDDAISQAKIMKSQGVKVDVYPIHNDISQEVQLTEINVPQFINKNVEYDVEISIDSLNDTQSRVKLYKGNELIVNKDINVRSGENKLVFSDISTVGGSVIYRAEIEPINDTMKENNTIYAYGYVEDIPSVLVIQKDNSASEIKKILEGSKLSVTSVEAMGAPTALERLNVYDSIILADVASGDLSEGFMEVLETYVKHTGGGVIVTGGENSYALGSYYNTPLEEILPVDMELKTDSQTPDLGLVIVIDHSGSMSDTQYGISIMEIAKEAAIRGIETLKETDVIGVIQFDSVAEWAVDFQKVGENLTTIKENIAKIQPAGGTSILPALDKAYRILKDSNTKMKHIILLTDGQAEQTGYNSIIEGMNENGITLSTIAVGSGADTKLLEGLAEKGKGRYYFTNVFTNLPEIFTKETFLAGKEYINNRSFFPMLGDSSPIMTGIESVAQLNGYIGTTPKSRADVILKSDADDPILASWQYGLGRTVAWTSDMNNKWTLDWLSSDEGVKIFRNMVSWSMRKQASNDITVTGEVKGKNSQVTVTMEYDENIKNVALTAVSSENKEYSMELDSTSPGIYTGELPTIEKGAYIVSVKIEKNDGEVENMNSGFHLPYSEEFDIRTFDKGGAVLSKIANITGGRVLESPEDVFIEDVHKVFADKDITSLLLLLGLLLFLIDIALRRFTFILHKIQYYFDKVRQNKIKTKNISSSTAVDEDKNKQKQVSNVEVNKEVKSEEKKKSTASLLAGQKKKRVK